MMVRGPQPDWPRPARNSPAWLTIAIVTLSGMTTALQFTLPIPLLPVLPSLLGVTPSEASWAVTATLLASTVATPIMSRMADMYGKRRMFILALMLMTVGSVIAALGDTFATVVIGRGFQGVASALIPIGIALLRDHLPPRRAGSAVALMSATLGIGSAMGLPLSGLLSEAFGWHSVFWFTAVIGALFAVLTFLLVGESPLRTGGRFDVVGALGLSAILTVTLLVISNAGVWEVGVLIALSGLTLAGFAGWVVLQLRTPQPMIDIRTSVKRPVLLTNIASVFTAMAMFANLLLTTQQVQAPLASRHLFELSISAAGLVMLPTGVVMVLLAPVNGWLLNRFGGRPVLVLGNVILAATFVFRIFVDDTLFAVVFGAALVGVGTALAFAAMPMLIMAAVPLTETASANGVNSLVRSLGTSLSSALLALGVSTMFVTVNGENYISPNGLRVGFLIAVICAVVAALIAAAVPLGSRSAIGEAGGDSAAEIIIIRGRVRPSEQDTGGTAAVVTFMNLDGVVVDWSRVDQSGLYSAVLPQAGDYVAVANARGWSPQTQMIHVDGGEPEWDVLLVERLRIQGVVRRGVEAVANALVVLHRFDGALLGTSRCDAHGAYSFALPVPGVCLLTVIEEAGRWAHTRKVAVGSEDVTLDLDVL